MPAQPLSVSELLREALQLGARLLDASEEAVLEKHARYCTGVARQIWKSACHLRGAIPADDREVAELDKLCVALEDRLVGTERRFA